MIDDLQKQVNGVAWVSTSTSSQCNIPPSYVHHPGTLVATSQPTVVSKLVSGLPIGTQAVAVIQAPTHQPMQILNGVRGSAAGSLSYAPPGVIYALSQYSPFISLPGQAPCNTSSPLYESENSNLGAEDAEVHQITTASMSVGASVQEQPVCFEPGKCQAGGELRLSMLSDSMITPPDGFSLVGSKSPILIGMTLVAAVDKRYLPSEENSVAMLGFGGNCIGCGATGFRYFTEFSTHINLKLATQPKKQKHLKYYIVKDRNGKWAKGPLIPWKGTETRKRNLPMYNMSPMSYGRTPELVPPYTMQSNKALLLQPAFTPNVKRIKVETNRESTCVSPVMVTMSSSSSPVSSEREILASPKPEMDGSLLSFKVPISLICGVRPVMLLCQNNAFKLPTNISDIIISDMLVGCFDFPGSSNPLVASTSSTAIHTNLIMSTSTETSESQQLLHSRIEQSAASTLISMSANNSSVGSGVRTKPTRCSGSKGPNGNEAPLCSVPLHCAVLSVIQYLASMEDYSTITREDVEGIIQRLRSDSGVGRHLNTLSGLSPSQLTAFANLMASSAKGKLTVMTSTYSFQNAIFKALRWVHDTFSQSKAKKQLIPNFIFILYAPNQGSIEFCFLVTGITQAKLLSESIGLQDIASSSLEEDLAKLEKQFKQTGDALEILLAAYEKSRGQQVYIPFNGYARMRINEVKAKDLLPKFAPSIPGHGGYTRGIFSNQVGMAQQLLSQLCTIAENPGIIELPSFCRVEVIVVVPQNLSLYYQTVKRLCESGILIDLGLESDESLTDHSIGEKYVLSYGNWPASIEIWNNFVTRIQKQSKTLYIIFFDQAHVYCLPQGMPDILPGLREVFESTNVIPVFITAVPYIFQTGQSFIDPDNEVFWTDAKGVTNSTKPTDDKFVKVNDQDMIYFGIKEFCDSTRWNQQYPLIRHEETFDLAVPRANRLNDISFSLVHGYVLIRLYRAALMVAGGVKPAEPHCVLSIIQMVRDIVEAPLRNQDGSGSMLMIRVPSIELGQYCQDMLRETRDSLGFKYRFDVIFDNGFDKFEVEDHFLQRMLVWKRKSGCPPEMVDNWYPRCLEELLDLPCILILSGKDRSGASFPRSLKYCDMHLIDTGNMTRSSIEAELGSVTCYLSVSPASNSSMSSKPINTVSVRNSIGTTYLSSAQLAKVVTSEPCVVNQEAKCSTCENEECETPHYDSTNHFSSKYPLPVILVSKQIWQIVQADQVSGITTTKLVNLHADVNVHWVGDNRPVLTNNSPDHQSRYYRHWTEARRARKMLTTPGVSSPSSPLTSSDDPALFNVIIKDTDQANDSKTDDSSHLPTGHHADDDQSDEESDKEQYHPRCILFSGAPQVGKTGAYFHFARIVHRMLMRLKRVDVKDNRITYTPLLTNFELAQFNGQAEWPNVDKIREMAFVAEFLDSEFRDCSVVHVCSVQRDVVKHQREMRPVKTSTHINENEGQQIVPVILSDQSAHNDVHHCDICKFYREGIGGNTTKVLDFVLNGFGKEKITIDLQFIIPAMHSKHFRIDDEQQTVEEMIFTATDQVNGHRLTVKTPILMASSGGEEEGMLNLFHAMEETDHIHIVFVKNNEMALYQKNWPNHVFAVLPPDMDDASYSAVKDVIKLFACQSYTSQVNRANGVSKDSDNPSEDVWPMFLLLCDSIVMWQSIEKESEPMSDIEVVNGGKEIDQDAVCPLPGTTSLLEVISIIESTPDILQYASIGLRPWSSSQTGNSVHGFLRTFIHSCVFLNARLVDVIDFNPNNYLGGNVDYQLKLYHENLITCRFERLSFMCRATNRKPRHVADIPSDWTSGSKADVNTDKPPHTFLVTPPDLEDVTQINAPSHCVMQKYLHYAGGDVFPASSNQPDTPVLVIGGYVDLGRSVTVCVVHTDLYDQQVPSKCQLTRKFGGLLLYGYSPSVNKEFLSQFNFVKDARLCIVSNDRYAMREEVQRLDLEDRWRFRFRDEYQTATHPDNKPVFFLTGTYD